MFCSFINLTVLFVTCLCLVGNVVNTYESDTELQSCIDHFEIHKDKIIRTQDSKNMGAKYLNEFDLGSREECLRLCCETETCDVFVYEEKSPGSCYLFHCGPPEDFKCKFTRHANYSSAMLTVNRPFNELETQIQLTKHEQDLTSLRKTNNRQQEVAQKTNIARTTTSPTTTSTANAKVNQEVLPILDGTKTTFSRRCSSYQFECRTSGECIAIYNACDGIPQCTDGSDEAPELGCPEVATTVVPSPPPPPISLPNTHNNVYGANQIRKSLPPLVMDGSYQQPSIIQANSRIVQPVDVSPDNTDFLRPIAADNSARGPTVDQNIYNTASVIRGQQQPFLSARPSNNDNWLIHANGNQMPVLPPNVQFADKNDRIFNHKENGLQVVDTPDSVPVQQYGDLPPRNDYPKLLLNNYGEIYRPQYAISGNWQGNRIQNAEPHQYVNDENWQPVQVPQNQPVINNNEPVYQQNIQPKTNWKQDLINTQAESKSYEHTIIREPKNFEIHKEVEKEPEHVKKQDPAVVNAKKEHKHEEKQHSHSKETTVEELKQNLQDLLDGESERPGGAVLSLTLGVCLTCVMAILIGCRLRIVRRRMRRGGKSPYAHDADYLVNGMYL